MPLYFFFIYGKMKNLNDILNNQLKEIKEISLQKQMEKEKIKKTKAKKIDEEEYFKKLDDKNKELLELLGNALFYSQNLSKNEAKNFEKIMKI